MVATVNENSGKKHGRPSLLQNAHLEITRVSNKQPLNLHDLHEQPRILKKEKQGPPIELDKEFSRLITHF